MPDSINLIKFSKESTAGPIVQMILVETTISKTSYNLYFKSTIFSHFQNEKNLR